MDDAADTATAAPAEQETPPEPVDDAPSAPEADELAALSLAEAPAAEPEAEPEADAAPDSVQPGAAAETPPPRARDACKACCKARAGCQACARCAKAGGEEPAVSGAGDARGGGCCAGTLAAGATRRARSKDAPNCGRASC